MACIVQAEHQDCSDITGRFIATLWPPCPNGAGWHPAELQEHGMVGLKKNDHSAGLNEQIQVLAADRRGTNRPLGNY